MTGSPIIARAVRHVLLASLLGVATGATAQNQNATQLEEVIVTGSAIRRVDAEASLPVQVIDADQISKTGASTVVELIQRLPGVQNSTMESESVGAENFGFAGVSLHNIGENRTLVLLNGRRMAQFGGQTLTGFAAAVDLNSIPVSAIQRVEVLTSGASALYGSDAVAGVINFITKDKSMDRDVSVRYYGPEDGGHEKGVSASGGIGDYESDGWNVFVSLAADKRTELNAVDRGFAETGVLDFSHGGQRWRFLQGSPRNIPANATATGGLYAGETVSLALLPGGAGTCPEGSFQLDKGCYYDFVRNIQLLPERERKSATASFNLKIAEAQNLFVDALWSQAKEVSKTAAVPGELGIEVGSPLYNQYLANVRDESGALVFPAIDENGDPVDTIIAPYRAFDLGQRTNRDKANFYHVSTGLEGELVGWSYNFALTQSKSDVKGSIAGYPGALALDAVLGSGAIDPFVGPGQQSSAGIAALDSVNYKGYWNGGVSKLQTAELTGSRSLFDLPNGHPVLLGLGVSYYKEKFQSKPSAFAQANLDDPVAGTPAAAGPHSGDQRFGDAAANIPYSANRGVFGAFAEVIVQPLDWLELTGSGRYDDYDDVGSTSNYKLSFKLTPMDRLLVRGSYGTGFHAPTVPQLNASLQSYGVTDNPYDQTPELQAIATSLGAILRPNNTQYDTFSGGNEDLKPEKSEQAMLGFVFEPSRQWSFGLDYWWVGIKDAFGQVTETAAFGDPNLYADAWMTFTDIATNTRYLAFNQTNVNTGKERYAGLDFTGDAKWDTGIGRLNTQLAFTRMLKTKKQQSKGGEYFNELSDYSSDLDEVTFKWSGRLMTTLQSGSWTHTVTFNYKSGYKDVTTDVDGIDANGDFNGETATVRLHVDDYYTVDWQTSWTPLEWLEVTVGALNLFDKDPPLSLVTANFQAGYDARYYDPRGRVLFGQASVKF